MSKDGRESSVFNWSGSGRTEKAWDQLGIQAPVCHGSHSQMTMWEGRQVSRQEDNDLGHFGFRFGLC